MLFKYHIEIYISAIIISISTLHSQMDKRSKLVIIIDDVSTPRQLKSISKIPYHITPSIFPPSKNLPYTSKMAKGLQHYMVHLPMEAPHHPQYAMANTLTTDDSHSKMVKRVEDLRRWFPTAIFVNNHTGSVFTSNYRALYDLYGILKENGFVFIDSRTTPKSKGAVVAKRYNDIYIHNSYFLDNIREDREIRRELKRAVKLSKRDGFAIVIGHPHRVTLRTISNSRDILKEVDVVYIDELFRYLTLQPELFSRIMKIVSSASVVGICKEFEFNQKFNQWFKVDYHNMSR